MPERITDELLLKRAASGEQTAFRELYERHRQPIYRFAYRLLGSTELAEDVTHDCFLGLLRKPENFQPELASLRTYLFASTRNLALKHYRDTDREGGIEEAEEPQASQKQEPLRQLLDQELSNQVKEALFKLPALQREALVLFEYEGLTLNEIAKISDTDVGAIKSRLYRARERLKALLGPYLNNGQQLNTGREIVTLREA